MSRLRNLLIRVRGGEPLPPGVSLDLERGERVLTWGHVRGAAYAIATDFRLCVLQADGSAPACHRWHEIARAVWADGELSVAGMDGRVADYQLSEPRGVPVAVREHVNASVVVSERHEVSPGVGVRVVGRRDLATGALVWSTVFDAGVDADNPAVRAQADGLLQAVRRKYGDAR